MILMANGHERWSIIRYMVLWDGMEWLQENISFNDWYGACVVFWSGFNLVFVWRFATSEEVDDGDGVHRVGLEVVGKTELLLYNSGGAICLGP